MLRLGFVQRAVSVPLICSLLNALESQQEEYLLHGDLAAKAVEVDTGHVWPSLSRWLKRKRPFRSLISI
jgi:hypothetical protein